MLPEDRPPLHLTLRSVGTHDMQRYRADLAELDQIARSEPGLIIERVDRMLSSAELVKRCQAAVLVLPYRAITHSGQLELARDLGLPLVAPDVPTLHAQLAETSAADHPCAWFPTHALRNPHEFSTYLEKSFSFAREPAKDEQKFANYRTAEHEQIIRQYESQYELSI